MELKAGSRLKSVTCTTEIMVVRPPQVPARLQCGGYDMKPASEAGAPAMPLESAHAGGTLLGKRYADEAAGMEVLCVKAGQGVLSLDGRALAVKQAKSLPASD